MNAKQKVLKTYFGYDTFRSGQERVIDALLAGNDALAIMPTGAGKSVCYQVPAMLLPGVTLVVSPLVSLMKDQVTQLVQMGIPAAFLNSSLSQRQYLLALDRAREGRYKLIYVAPERLDTAAFLSFVRSARISMVAVDEAHCISQWGQDFRPAYLKIPEFVDGLPERPVLGAFTATATPEVREDMERLLSLREPLRMATGFDRENLCFEVRRPAAKKAELLTIVKSHAGECGIVYCATRKNVEEVCAFLQDEGISAARYHAGLTAEERRGSQDDFLYDRSTVMVATNAFGMGIDKSNVRYVVHYNMPKDLESYYQEAGRAGRDGAPASCILLYSGRDVRTNEFLMSHGEPNGQLDEASAEQLRERDLARLRQMTFYCHSRRCLRQYILRYFGEQSGDYCGNCYNCLHNFEEVDITAEARQILRCVAQTGQRFGIHIVTGVLSGADQEKIRRNQLQKQSSYGSLGRFSREEIQERIRCLMENGYLQLSEGQYPVLKLGARAGGMENGGTSVFMKTVRAERPAKKEKAEITDLDRRQKTLFERLRALRSDLARGQGVPAYVVLSDRTLRELCVKMPRTGGELLEVSGIGSNKSEQYGKLLLEEIAAFERNA